MDSFDDNLSSSRPIKRQRLETSVTRTLLCIARVSDRHLSEAKEQLLRGSNEGLKQRFLAAADPLWLGALYEHRELAFSSNENIALYKHQSCRELRMYLSEVTPQGPLTIVISQEDGLTTNAVGLVQLFQCFIKLEDLPNITIFVCKLDGHYSFTAQQYLEAYGVLTRIGETFEPERIVALEDTLRFLATQVDVSVTSWCMCQHLWSGGSC